MRFPAILMLLGAVACSGDDSSSERPTRAACVPAKGSLTAANRLACPFPSELPFDVDYGFASKANADVEANAGCSKDQASDVIGNPGGAQASVYIADAASPAAGAIPFHGEKARAASTSLLLTEPLPGETVSLWFNDGTEWTSLGEGTTDASGRYDIDGDGWIPPNGEPVYAVLEADGGCAEHYAYLYPPTTKVVVIDIDGTLTTDDAQIVLQSSNASYVPLAMTHAVELTKAWAETHHYPVIYLTARQHALRAESRSWLSDLGFTPGPLITEGGTLGADAYKTLWLQRMTQSFGWEIFAAYGNADTDITAYENAGIAKDHTFIIGPLAGTRGTQPIANMDYTSHIADFVAKQPVL